ncbi:MAG: hypothetical protein H0T79_23145 [Deltaproteobacteria bacterium]|nr:hypothetical protein [Deltaproteobacteria bacterium]
MNPKLVGLLVFVVVAALVAVARRHPDAAMAFATRWAAPIIMTLAYVTLAITSDVDNTGKAWMTMGLAFVLVVWWIVRLLTGRAALARAIGVGDAERILALASKELASRRNEVARAPFRLACATAHDIRGEWREVIAELDRVDPGALAAQAPLRQTATTMRVGALVELGDLAAARAALGPSTIGSLPLSLSTIGSLSTKSSGMASSDQLHGVLAEGRVLTAEGAHDQAEQVLVRVTDNIRATPMQRATAFHYRAQLATTRGDAKAAAAYRAEVSRFAPTSWMTPPPHA